MQSKYDLVPGNEQDPQRVSQFEAQALEQLLAPFLPVLMCLVDKRLVESCLQ